MRYLLLDLRSETAIYLFFPVLYPLHNIMEEGAGTLDESGAVRLPGALRLTQASLDSKGIYLLENGVVTMIWLGSECDNELAKFLQMIATSQPVENDEYATRVQRIIRTIQAYFWKCYQS